jgi:hypothetical protein
MVVTEKNTEVTSRETKPKIKLWYARLGGVRFERLKDLGKLYLKLVKLPLTDTFDEVCQCSNAANKQHSLSRRACSSRRKTHTDECDILTPVISRVEEQREHTFAAPQQGDALELGEPVDVMDHEGVHQRTPYLSKKNISGSAFIHC